MPLSTSAAILRTIYRRSLVSIAVILLTLGALVVALTAQHRAVNEALARRDALEQQVALLSTVLRYAAVSVESPKLAGVHRRYLGDTLDLIAQGRACPRMRGTAEGVPAELRALYIGGYPSLCDIGDRVIATARTLEVGKGDPRSLMRTLELRIWTLRDRLRIVYDWHRADIEAVQRREQAATLGASALIALMIVLQAALILRPGWRLVSRTLASEAETSRALAAVNEALTRQAAEDRELRREAEDARRQAEAADRLKAEFLARVSHELCTPLNGVLGAAALLERGAQPEQRAHIAAIRDSGRSLIALIDDTLDLARLSSGDVTLDFGLFDIEDGLAGPVEATARRAARKGLAFSVACAPDAAGLYIGDQTRLMRAVGAVLDNAVKFTEHGGVRLAVGPAPCGLSFAVEDDGPGVPEADYEQIFAHFAQVDGSATRPKGGLGQGLALSRAILRAMGGEIGVTESPSGGARFWIRAPLLRAGGGAQSKRALAS